MPSKWFQERSTFVLCQLKTDHSVFVTQSTSNCKALYAVSALLKCITLWSCSKMILSFEITHHTQYVRLLILVRPELSENWMNSFDEL